MLGSVQLPFSHEVFEMIRTTIAIVAMLLSASPVLAQGASPTPKPQSAMHGAMQHDAMKHDAMQHDAMKHDAMKHDAMKHDAMKHDAMKHDAMPHATSTP
jgi:pentapeptide MXKDX repeat protein